MLLLILFSALRTGFEPVPTVLETGMLPLHYRSILLIHQDSNLNSKSQNLGCCQLHYGSVLCCFAEQTGIEPVPLVFQTNVHTLYTTLPGFVMGNR